jgi:hypothetical protein
MKLNTSVRNALNSKTSKTYVIFRTVDFDSDFHPDLIVLIALKTSDYDELMGYKRVYEYFDRIPPNITISCKALRYRAEANEYVLDEYCPNTSIQACRIQNTTKFPG